jgi:hypothetical protein
VSSLSFQYFQSLPVALLFCAILWVMVFLETYGHFPKMERGQRLGMSAANATALSLALLALVVISLYVLFQIILLQGSV